MDYDKPQKCLDLNYETACPIVSEPHVCEVEDGHPGTHRCACGAAWGPEEKLLTTCS